LRRTGVAVRSGGTQEPWSRFDDRPRRQVGGPLEPYVVRVVFVDGEIRDVEIEPLLSEWSGS